MLLYAPTVTCTVHSPGTGRYTRARACSSRLPSSRGNDTASSSRPMPSLSLIDEDEEMDYWGNEEDEEGYNDDDDHYVDVEDE